MSINEFFTTSTKDETAKKRSTAAKGSGDITNFFTTSKAAPVSTATPSQSGGNAFADSKALADTSMGDGSELSQGVADTRKPDSLLARIGRAILPHTVEVGLGIAEEQRKPKELSTADTVRLVGTAQTVEQMRKNPTAISPLEYLQRGISFGNELDPTNITKGFHSTVSVTDLPEPVTVQQKIAQGIGSVLTMAIAQPLIEEAAGSLVSKIPGGARLLETVKTAGLKNPWTIGYATSVAKAGLEGGLFGLITNNRQTVAKNVLDTAGTFAAFSAIAYPLQQFFKPILESVGTMDIQNPNLKRIIADPEVTQKPISKTLWFKNPKDPNQMLKVTANGLEFVQNGSKEVVEAGSAAKNAPVLTNLDIEAFEKKPSLYQNLRNWLTGKTTEPKVSFTIKDVVPEDTPENPSIQISNPAIENMTSAELRDSIAKMESTAGAPAGYDPVIANQLSEAKIVLQQYEAAHKDPVVVVQAPDGSTAASIHTVEYSDGKIAIEINAQSNSTGFMQPAAQSELYPNEAAAIEAGKKEIVTWAKEQLKTAEADDVEQLKNIVSQIQKKPNTDTVAEETVTPNEQAVVQKDEPQAGEQQTIYYHGTSKENAAKILKDGFNTESVALTPDMQEAREYGDTVIAVRVKENAAAVDTNGSREPLYMPADIRVIGDTAATDAEVATTEPKKGKRIGLMDYHGSYTPNMRALIKEAQDSGDFFPYSKMSKEEQGILDKAWKDTLDNLQKTEPQLSEDIVDEHVKEAIVNIAVMNEEYNALEGEIFTGESVDGEPLTPTELEAKGTKVKKIKAKIKAEAKVFVDYQNGLTLEPVKKGEKPVEIAGEMVKPEDMKKPILTRTDMVTILKSSPEFKANPVLVVEETPFDGLMLSFRGEKQSFMIKPSALSLVEKNLTPGLSININPETFKTTGTDSFRVNEYKDGVKQSGSFASMDKFNEDIAPVERVIDAVNPIEFPELVKLARELTGEFPKVKLPRARPSMGGARPNGIFIPKGDGTIILNPDLFIEGNEQQAAKTLAHEIGHLIDWLPDKTMIRGNVLGRLNTLRDFRKDFLPDQYRMNSDLARELWALSKYWKPIDEATASPGYLAYRKSAVEVYADFISVLFNNPQLAQDLAPAAYNLFFGKLDAKPEVKAVYFELQDLLSGTSEEIMKARSEDIRKGFARGEELQAGFKAKKELAKGSFWQKLRMQLDDINYAILKKQREVEATGKVIPEDQNPRFLLQEQSYADNENYLMVEKIDREIVKPIEAAGMIVEDIGEYLLLDRIINERVNIANPFGFNTKNAPKQMEFLEKTVGAENFKLLKQKVADFHDLIFESVQEAADVGSYNKELFETKIKPNKEHYASFQVVDYMQDYVPATIKAQTGTLKEVANPFISTILKTVALNRLNVHQRAKNATVALLKENFPDEITETKRITTDGKLSVFRVGKDRGALELLEDGKMQSYDVDPYIAESFNKDKAGDLNAIVALIDKFNNKLFKPVVTTYNLGFAAAFNPIRDIKRNYKLIPNANFIPFRFSKSKGIKIDTAGNLLRAYVSSLGSAIKFSKGQLDDFTRTLVESKAMNAPVNDYNFDAREDELGAILAKYGIIKKDQPFNNKTVEFVRRKLLRPVTMILEGIRFTANTFEVVSKIAGAKIRMAGGESGKQLAYNLRNYTGTPNYKVRGKQTSTTNAIFVFSNIAKEGLKSDFHIATDPKTRSGYWFKTVKVDLIPKLLMFLASAGAFGIALKKFYGKVSEYDKSNYIILPLGTQADGKAMYMRMPHDQELGRVVSVTFWKMLRYLHNDGQGKELQDIFAVGAGQLPSVTPLVSIIGGWSQYLAGKNPYDSFRGRPVVDDLTWSAGGGAALKKMVQWTTNTLGFTKFATYDTSKNTGVETFMQTAPWFSTVIKISDYGEQEQLKTIGAQAKQQDARESLKERDIVTKYVNTARENGTLSLAKAKLYGQQAATEMLGHAPKNADEKAIQDRLTAKFKVATKRGLADDPRITALLNTSSNNQKKQILLEIKANSTPEEFNKLRGELLTLKVVNPLLFYDLK